MAFTSARPATGARRIDIAALKQTHPIEAVVPQYGVELKRQGRGLVGRCPFHRDGGRPNLIVFPTTQSWHCFRCGVGGDLVKFVMLAEDVGFLDAVRRLDGRALGPLRSAPQQLPKAVPASIADRDPDELAALQAAVTVYHHNLLAEPRALAYLDGRGLDRSTIEQCRLGYASGDQLVAYLRWQRLPIGPALRVGLITRGGAEFMAGRIVVPDLHDGRPAWLIGRLQGEAPDDDVPVHLWLPGSKPLLGLGMESTRYSATVMVVEGSFDYLTLRRWGYPAVATLGTHVRADLVDELRAFKCQFLVLDNDDAGLEAKLALQQQLGPSAIPVSLPEGIKDPAQLATRPDGPKQFAAALLESVGQLPADAAETQ
jgi:DNA primase